MAFSTGPKTIADDATGDEDVLRRTLDQAFATLADVLAAGDSGALAHVIAATDTCRAQLTIGGDIDVLQRLAATCFEETRSFAADSRQRAAGQRAQVAALVATIRETVATITGGEDALAQTLTGSADRFQRLAQMDDIQQIQAQLVKEVADLKRLTQERRAAWERTVEEFGQRLVSLETQLDRTRREASVDPLTNIANRRTFERTCRDWLKPNGPGFVMAMMDVDDFKKINDRHGHAIGDRVLVAVAETLTHSFRGVDLVARLGGDEFVVLAAGLTLTQAQGRLTSIGRAVHEACAAIVPDGAASISIGVAECSAGDTLESLQHRADGALYQAKRNGKGRVAAKASPLLRDLRKPR